MKYTPHAPYEWEHSFIYRFAFLDRDSESSSHFEVWRSIILHIVFYFAREAVAFSSKFELLTKLHSQTSQLDNNLHIADLAIIQACLHSDYSLAPGRHDQIWASTLSNEQGCEWELKVKLGFSKSFLSLTTIIYDLKISRKWSKSSRTLGTPMNSKLSHLKEAWTSRSQGHE